MCITVKNRVCCSAGSNYGVWIIHDVTVKCDNDLCGESEIETNKKRSHHDEWKWIYTRAKYEKKANHPKRERKWNFRPVRFSSFTWMFAFRLVTRPLSPFTYQIGCANDIASHYFLQIFDSCQINQFVIGQKKASFDQSQTVICVSGCHETSSYKGLPKPPRKN